VDGFGYITYRLPAPLDHAVAITNDVTPPAAFSDSYETTINFPAGETVRQYASLAEALPGRGTDARPAAGVRVRTLKRQPGQEAHGGGRREHRRVVPVALVDQRALADRVEPVEREAHPAAIRPHDRWKPTASRLWS